MRPSTVLESIRRGIPAFATALRLGAPATYEMISSLGYDAIWMDLEHHSLDEQQAASLIRAARAGGNADVIARPGKGEFMRMARLLEAGAKGIMYPRCESVSEAKEVVRWAKFAPLGERGFDGAGADGCYMSHSTENYLQLANANTFVIIQIEDQRTLSQCEEIACIHGIDMLMLGPGDFSILSGFPGELEHDAVRQAQARIAAAAKEAGKHWASVSWSLQHAKSLLNAGASLVFYGADIVLIRKGMTEALDDLKLLGSPVQDDHLV